MGTEAPAFHSPTLSFESLRRSRATVEDFVRSYFYLHRIPLDAFLNFMDVLIYVEASIYEADERNEAEAEDGMEGMADTLVRPAEGSATGEAPEHSLFQPAGQFIYEEFTRLAID